MFNYGARYGRIRTHDAAHRWTAELATLGATTLGTRREKERERERKGKEKKRNKETIDEHYKKT